MASVVNGKTIVMADETVHAIMVLNKLWIPDVLIDIIKDYLYIDTKTVIRNFYKASINLRIGLLDCGHTEFFDRLGRVRCIHWSKGHDYSRTDCVQLQTIICGICGESEESHQRLDRCCAMEGDGVDGTLEVSRGDYQFL